MRIDLQNMNRTMVGKGTHAWNVDRMITANHNRQGPSSANGTHGVFDPRMALFGISMHDVCISDIDDPCAFAQIGHIVFMVVCACMTKGEQG